MARYHDYIAELLDKYEPAIRDAFLQAINDIRSSVQLLRVIERLERGDVAGAMDAMQLDQLAYRPVERAIAEAYEAGGIGGAGSVKSVRDPSGGLVVVRFDGRDPRAEAWLREQSSGLITRINDDQRAAIRGALTAGMERGDNPRRVALDVVGRIDRSTGRRTGGVIGLTEQQAQFVENARQELSSGDPAAMRRYLGRERRDRRFDRTVLKAIREGRPVPVEQIEMMTRRYADRLLQLRGEMLARTEAMTALHAGQDEAFRQAVDRGQVAEHDVRRVWRSAGDRRVRHTHRGLNGESVGLNESFTSPSGARLRYPGDPLAPASERVGCRCSLRVRVDFLANVS